MTEVILALNVGSSSVKFALFDYTPDRCDVMRGKVDWLDAHPVFLCDDGSGEILAPDTDVTGALRRVMSAVEDRKELRLKAFVHRIVHGGDVFRHPVRLDRAALEKLAGLQALAPLHQGYNLNVAEIMMEAYPELSHIGCFDTGFHHTIPEVASTYALPAHIRDKGVRRYGFHGLSYESIARSLAVIRPDLAGARIVAAHLGSGASLCAMKAGRSVATTMGLTALDGLPMATRAGAVDPGAVLYMARNLRYGVEGVEEILYRQSGLLGLSGVSNDMRELRKNASPGAAVAIDYFAYRIAEEIARLTAALGGLDAVVFTGGIGENDDALRRDVAGRLSYLQPFDMLAVPADEERVMAKAAYELVAGGQSGVIDFSTRMKRSA